MNKTYTHLCKGTCSRSIAIILENGIVKDISFSGGCDGNAKGIALLAKNRDAEELIKTLKGINCDGRGTSCPDQLARGLEQALKEQKNGKL